MYENQTKYTNIEQNIRKPNNKSIKTQQQQQPIINSGGGH